MLSKIFNNLNRPKTYLLLTNVLMVFFLIVLSNLQILPIKYFSDFVFFSVVYLAFALYRPGWSFLFFVGAIALENINLASQEIGIMVRPYQFIGGLTIAAALIKLAFGRLGFNLPKWNRFDLLFVIFTIAGFVSAFGASDKNIALKQSVIIGSFVALYFLVRVFVQSFDDLKKTVPFFLSSSLVVLFYGIWQNIRFKYSLASFEVMPGRPNATFAEPDWLGVYLVFVLAIMYALIYYFNKKSDEREHVIFNFKFLKLFLYIILTTSYILLILTVSRSAWLGALAVTFVFLFSIGTTLKINPKNWEWKSALRIKVSLLLSFVLGLALVYVFDLTSFQLYNRAQSTGSGLQKITASCNQEVSLPEKITSVSELARYNCRHINLEEIQAEKAAGYFVTEIFRLDPNINIRSQIYQKSWQEIKNHPILGIGWGNIGHTLGPDGRGTELNSSNIFLEVWLGSGIIGLLAFLFISIYVFITGLQKFTAEQNILGLFCLLGFFALLIPNLFNAGIMLGFVWVFFAITAIKR